MQKLSIIFIFSMLSAIVLASEPISFCDNGAIAARNGNMDEAILIWRKGGMTDEIGSQVSVVLQCLKKEGFVSDDKKLQYFLEHLAEQGSLESIIVIAVHNYNRLEEDQDTVKNVLHWLNVGIERGIPDAKYILARMHLNGDGIKEDIPYGLKLLREAAEEGSIIAQSSLAFIYKRGAYGVQKNLEKSEWWENRANETARVNSWPSLENSRNIWGLEG